MRDKKTNLSVELKDVFELVSDVSEGTFDVEQTYGEALQALLEHQMEKFQPGVFDNMKVEELKTIHLAFIGALIEKKVLNENYLNKNYIKDIIASSENKSREVLLKQIRALQK